MKNILKGKTLYYVMLNYREEGKARPSNKVLATYFNEEEARCHRLHYSLFEPGGQEYTWILKEELNTTNISLLVIDLYSFNILTEEIEYSVPDVCIFKWDIDTVNQYANSITLFAHSYEEALNKFIKYKEGLNEE